MRRSGSSGQAGGRGANEPWALKGFEPAKNPQNVPPGWQIGKLNGKRVAITPPPKGRKRGKVTTYNQYLNAQARQSGFESHSDYKKKAKKFREYRTGAKGIAKNNIGLGSENLRLLNVAIFGPVQNDYRPGGAWAQALEAIGWRAKGADYNVGETP